eukprot:1160745-Pelagomonas_calceolata.AAC.8
MGACNAGFGGSGMVIRWLRTNLKDPASLGGCYSVPTHCNVEGLCEQNPYSGQLEPLRILRLLFLCQMLAKSKGFVGRTPTVDSWNHCALKDCFSCANCSQNRRVLWA